MTPAPPGWQRLLIVHLLQLPAIALLVFATSSWAWLVAGLWGSLTACAGTDSLWRWRNRLLVAEAVVWLSLALSAAF